MIASPHRIVWETWHRQRRGPIARKEELAKAAARLGATPKQVVDELVRRRYVTGLFRGVYYVRDPEEIALGIERYDPLHLFGLGAPYADLGRWYFALESAERLAGESQEHRTTETIVSDTGQRAQPINIAGRRFEILRWSGVPMDQGIGKIAGLPVAAPSRTVVDHLYRDYWRIRNREAPTGRWRSALERASHAEVQRHLARFPKPFQTWARQQIAE